MLFRNFSYACRTFLAFGFIALWLSSASAQNGQEEQQESRPLPVPNAANLQSGWWNFVAADKASTPQRIKQVQAMADSAVAALPVEMVVPAQEAVDRLRSNLASYQREVQRPLPDLSPAVRMTGSFSLKELLEIERNLANLGRAIQDDSARLRDLQLSVDAQRALVDRQRSDYEVQQIGSAERVMAGMTLMAERSALEASQLALARLEKEIEQKRAYRDALRSQSTAARSELKPSADRATELEQLIQAAQTARTQAQQQVRELEEALQSREENSQDQSSFEITNLRQQLLAAKIDRREAELRETRYKAELIWLENELDADNVDLQEADQLDQWDEQLERAANDLGTWRNTIETILLTPPPSDRQQRSQFSELRTTAQQNLATLDATQNVVEEFTTIRDLVEQQLLSQGSAWERTWAQITVWWAEFSNEVGRWMAITIIPLGDDSIDLGGLIRIIVFLIIAYWISRLVRNGIDRIGARQRGLDTGSLYTLGRLMHYFIMVLALVLGLSSIGLDFGSFALIAGALSVGIGFGLQSIVNNFVSGLILLFERSLKVGDYVELESGVAGLVREINIRSTRINTNDNLDILVPNSEFVTGRLTNWTLREPMARFRIPFGVAYGSDKDLVRQAALEAAEKVDFTLKNMPNRDPEVWLVNFGDSSLDFELLVWVSRQGVRRPNRVRARYLWELESQLGKYNIEIPFPQRDLHMRSDFREPDPSPPKDIISEAADEPKKSKQRK